MKISNQPPKGTRDWFPDEFRARKYIFDTWREVCTRFGYEEYLTPIVEDADVYRAKSGEDIGGKELMVMTDRAGRELAIRPEMTPSVTRMISKIYESEPKPIRYFSIANFLRNEKPQRGRNREFWQLNFDIFGADSFQADVEILQMAIEIMLAFGADESMFKVYVNDRIWIKDMVGTYIQAEVKDEIKLIRLLDKYQKLKSEEFISQLKNLCTIGESEISKLLNLLRKDQSSVDEYMDFMKINYPDSKLNQIMMQLEKLGYGKYIEFNPSMVRGFDYYDGMVFEVFDQNPENNRSMFGGGRYNGLAEIFGAESFPAVGCAPGDETTKLFLEAWNLIPNDLRSEVYYLPVIDENLVEKTVQLAQKLRKEGKNVKIGLEPERVGKALSYADKAGIDFVILFGENECKENKYVVKIMSTGEQRVVELG